MALSPEVIAAFKAVNNGKLPTTLGMKPRPQEPVDPTKPALPGYKPLVYAPPPTSVAPPAPEPTYLGDLSNAYASGLDTSQANIQRALTKYGVGDFTESEQANRELAAEETAQISPETQQAMQAITADESGIHGVNARGLGGLVAQGVGNVGTAAGVVGGALQKIPNPLLKAAGYGLGAVSNALDIGGNAAYDVSLQGGTPEQEKEALLGGTALGALSGVADVALLSKIGGLAGLDKASAKASLEQLTRNQVPGAAERLAAVIAEEEAAAAAPLATKALAFGKDLTKTVAVGATGEAIQEYGESAGQQVVENVALNKPWEEGAHPAGMLGAFVGGISGGAIGGGTHVGVQALQKLAPKVTPGAANATGADRPDPVLSTDAARNIDLSVSPAVAAVAASNVNDAAGEILGTAPLTQNNTTSGVEAAPIGGKEQPPKISEKLNALLRQPQVIDTIPSEEGAELAAAQAQTPIPAQQPVSLLRDTEVVTQEDAANAAPPLGEPAIKPLVKQQVVEAPTPVTQKVPNIPSSTDSAGVWSPGVNNSTAQEREADPIQKAYSQMNREEFADFLATDEGKKRFKGLHIYDAITRRPELRWVYDQTFGEDPVSALDNAAGLSYTQRRDLNREQTTKLTDIWQSIKNAPMAGVKAVNGTWSNFVINGNTNPSGSPRPSNHSTEKSYIRLSDPTVLLDENFTRGLLEAIANSGANGQTKIAPKGGDLISHNDNIVMHGASRSDADLMAKAANDYLQNNVAEISTGTDANGTSYSDILAGQTEKKRIEKSTPAVKPLTKQPVVEAPTPISEVSQGQATQDLRTAVQGPSIDDRLAKFAESDTLKHVQIGNEEETKAWMDAGTIRMRRNRKTGVVEIPPQFITRIADTRKAGNDRLADALMTQLETAKNHEDIHGVISGPEGFTPAFRAIETEASTRGTKAHEWIANAVPLLLRTKTYRDKFNSLVPGLSDLDLGNPAERRLAVQALMTSPQARELAVNELLAGHPNRGTLTEDEYGNYVTTRTGLLQKVGASDELINMPIPDKLHDMHMTDLLELIAPAPAPAETSTPNVIQQQGEEIAEQTEGAPLSGMTVTQSGTYYTDSKGGPVDIFKNAASSNKLDLSNAAPDSIVQRAVKLMHTLSGNETGAVEKVTDTQYKIGNSVYNLEKEGDSYRVVPATGFDENNDVTIEAKGGKYRTKVENFNKRRGEVLSDAAAARYLKEGETAANTLLANDSVGNANLVTKFRDSKGKVHPISVSSLRSLGASLSDRPNDTLANKLLNVKEGVAYTETKIGPLLKREVAVGPKRTASGRENKAVLDITLRDLIISDAGPLSDESSRVTFAEAQTLSDQETQETLDASRRAEAIRTLMTGKKGKASKLMIARVADELNGELLNDPKLNRAEWMREELAKAEKAAKNYTGTEAFGEQEAGKDLYARTLESDEPGTEFVNAPAKASVAPSTRELHQHSVTNRAGSDFATQRVVTFLNGLLAKLRIPTAFTLYDSDSNLSRLPAFAAESIASTPHQSQFIAVDSKIEGHREHIIYIARTNKDGSPRTKLEMSTDLAHEFGHFIQRVSLDFIVRSAIQGGNHDSQILIAKLLGLETTDDSRANPLLQYQNMNIEEQDAIDEMFAERLAAELLRAKNLDVDGVTFLDAVGAVAPEGFFRNLANMLINMFKKFAGARAYEGDFHAFMMAMTGRVESKYYDAVQAGGRFAMIQPTVKNRVQFHTDPMQRTSQFTKMLNSRFAKSVGTGMTHWFGLDSELWHMKSPVATWIARTFSGKTGDVKRKYHEDNYLKFVSMAWGDGKLSNNPEDTGLLSKYQPVIEGLPVFGKTLKSTPIGDAFMAELHKHNSLQAPLWAVPDTNFVVEETNDGRKNVTVNLRDQVAKLRKFYAEDLYNFQTAEGMPLKKINNYYPFLLTRENVMKHEDNIRAILAADIVNELVWEKDANGNDVQTTVNEAGWTEQKIKDFIGSFANNQSFDRDPFPEVSSLDDLRAKMTAATGHVGILGGDIAATANNAKKARKLSAARRQRLMPFSEADASSLIMVRTGEAVKARASDHMWGSWVVVGGKAGTANRGDYTLMDRQRYKDWVALQHSRANDAIVTVMGHPNLTDGQIEAARAMGGLDPKIIKAMVAARKGVIAEALAAENMDPRAVKAREIQAKLDAALDRNYYSSFAKMDAALAEGEEKDEISQADVIRIKDTIIPAMLGRLGQKEISPSWRATQAYVMTAMNVMYLPLMVFSAIAELPQIAIRMYDPILGNGMFASQAKMLRTVGELIVNPNGERKKEAATMLRAIGLIKDSAIDSAMTTSTEGEFMPVEVKKFNQTFFELTQIKRFTEFERKAAYLIAKDAFVEYATRAKGNGPEAAQAQAQADAIGLDVDATLALMGDNARWINTKNFQDAMYNWVDEANLRPGPNTRPARMSDPRFALIWYLKDFSWAMQAKTLTYIVQQARLQPDVMHQLLPWISAAIPMMIAGGLGAYARELLTNELPSAILGTKPMDRYATASSRISAAVTRSGMLGPMELLYSTGANYSHRGLPWVGALSPIASLLQEAALTGSIPTAKRHIPGIAQLSQPNKKFVLEAMGLGNAYAK